MQAIYSFADLCSFVVFLFIDVSFYLPKQICIILFGLFTDSVQVIYLFIDCQACVILIYLLG